MSINLLDVAKGYLTKELVGKASSFLGEDEASTQSGINHVLPAILGTVVAKSDGDKAGANDIFNMVSRPEFGGGLLNNLGDLFGGGETANKSMDLGGSLLRGLLGDKMGGVVDLISQATGMKSGSSSGLMKMLLPVLMSIIGKKVKSEGLGLDGLLGMLMGQKEHIKKEAPAGFMDSLMGTLGMGGLSSAASGFAKSSEPVKEKVVASRPTPEPEKSSPGMFSRILPLLLLLGALALAFFLWKGCNDNEVSDDLNAAGDKIEQGAKDLGDKVESGVESLRGDARAIADRADMSLEEAIADLGTREIEVVDRGAEGVYNLNAAVVGKAVKGFENLGVIINKELKDGTTIIIPEYGIENQLISYIESGKGVDKEAWFNFDRILFDTGSSTVRGESMGQVENIAAIMKAYPDVNMKLGGYTDNVGNPDSNLKLSDDRAKAVVAAIVAKGVDAGRLAGEGYGEQHPVASNDTKEGRAKNRRTAVRIAE